MQRSRLILRFRIVLAIFILGLVLSGLSAFPLGWEVDTLARWLGVDTNADLATLTGLRYWIAFVREGLGHSYDRYPFLAYGTDWLAFAHLAIAVFFVGPLREPTRHDWVLVSGIIACAGVIPLALICGPLRGIPFSWRLIDCSFGVFGAIPLAYCLSLSRRLKRAMGGSPPNSSRGAADARRR
jgi:hypothetical protein